MWVGRADEKERGGGGLTVREEKAWDEAEGDICGWACCVLK